MAQATFSTACSEPGAKGPGLAISGRFASSRRPPAGFSANAKKAAQTPAPLRPTREKVVAAASLFPRGMARETLSEKGKTPVHSVGKARAHALRARAEQPASPRATASGRPRPLVRDYRRPRRAAVRAGQL